MTRVATAAGVDSCIRECTTCHAICVETARWLVELDGCADGRQIQMLLDCAEMCQTNANFLLRGSDFEEQTSNVCAEICMRCAEECERIGVDELLAQCAEVCRSCAESCRRRAVGHV